MNIPNFSLIIRMCRENAGLTQKQVAEALNIERSTYAYYESGMTHPSGATIVKLAKIFNIDYNVLMDSIGDFDSQASVDDSQYKYLKDPVLEEREKLCMLSPHEQELVLLYRSLTLDQKKIVNEMIYKFNNDNDPVCDADNADNNDNDQSEQ